MKRWAWLLMTLLAMPWAQARVVRIVVDEVTTLAGTPMACQRFAGRAIGQLDAQCLAPGLLRPADAQALVRAAQQGAVLR